MSEIRVEEVDGVGGPVPLAAERHGMSLGTFDGSPALSMMRGRHPAHRSSFSREFSVVPGRKSADFIESAGEPKIDPLGDTKTAPSWTLVEKGMWTKSFRIWSTCMTRRRAKRI